MNILSIRDIDAAVVQFGLVSGGRRKDEYIKSRKFKTSVSMSYFSRSALKSPSKTSVLIPNESFANRFAR